MKEQQIFDISENDAQTFDRLLTEFCTEATRREKNDVNFWRRVLEDGGTSTKIEYAKGKLTAAEDKLEEAFRRQMLWITSSLVTCDDPRCERHRALFVGIA